MSRTVAAAVFALYHAANLRQLAAGRHLSITAGAMIVAPPYLVGALLLLEPASALQALGGLVAGLPPLAHETLELLARILVVFAFNAVVVQAVGIAVARIPLRSVKAHALLGRPLRRPRWPGRGSRTSAPRRRMAAAGAARLPPWRPRLSQAGLWAEVYLVTAMIMACDPRQIPGPASLWEVGRRAKKGMVYSGVFMAMSAGPGPALASARRQRCLWQHYPWPMAALVGAALFPLAKTIIETFDGSQAFFRRTRAGYRQAGCSTPAAPSSAWASGYAVLQLP